MDAAQRPAAVPRRVVRPDLRAAPRGGHRRAAAPDGQGAQPDPALHPRPRPRPADVAGPAGRPGARDRGRADQRPDPAQHPALRLVAGRGVGPRRGRGGLARPAGARHLPAEGADRAPRGAVPLRARVHPRRAAGLDGLPAPRLGDLGGGRRARRHAPAWATAAASCWARPAPRRGARWRGTRGWPRRSGARPGLTAVVGGLGSRQVVPDRADRLQDAARRRPLDGARPVRAAGGADPPARARAVLPAHQPAARRPRHPQPLPGGGRAAGDHFARRGRARAGVAAGALAGRGDPAPAGARRAHRPAALRRRPAAAHPDRAAARRPRGRRRAGPAPRPGHRHAAPARPRRRGARRRGRRLPRGASRAAAGRAAVPGRPAATTPGRPTATTG